MSAWRGAVRWAFVPFVPAAPFRVFAGAGFPPIEEADATDWARRIYEQRGSGDQSFVVPGKLRQVLVLEEKPTGSVQEVAALRLVRLDTLSDARREKVRQQQDDALFHLRPASHPDLKQEMAVSVQSLVRVGVSAFVDTANASRLNENEFRVVCERLVRMLGLDISLLVESRARAMIRSAKQP